jgi:hypothetical protein
MEQGCNLRQDIEKAPNALSCAPATLRIIQKNNPPGQLLFRSGPDQQDGM